MARLQGFIRPPPSWEGTGEILKVCASYSQATLKLSKYSESLKVVANISSEQSKCVLASWPSLDTTR